MDASFEHEVSMHSISAHELLDPCLLHNTNCGPVFAVIYLVAS